jgi:alanine racemase
MDLIAVDVTEVPEAEVKRGDFAALIGDGITVDDFAAHAGTIGYEVLANLGRRYARIYLGA